ncbi:5-methyltetrahydropteroyltriglutamate--homocysteine S-methyltransferase [Luteolibacter arcticus]|uniref:5-methyltetrahydropteroyltriglutamate--homocysteine methyltransferase n=1 Tax=Luteolibacter arcticus TaxID=1581411 RepID=A0ABT3GSI7_9BACT|nr:5-methyltetrahydropteroyltriglutamate--homocysteine S-methyltransferase [Luteolibacter arcticus]MCW1926433.1 5-methyltetrahydropteroyltriglutamate--homocysteine S-methyltransferase [Luteolibacter arcticus]
MNATTHVSGYPRIGEKRELKQALEAFWSGKLDASGLDGIAKELRLRHWQEQAGLSFAATNDFSLYDGMLDLACTFGAIPERFGPADSPMTLERYFRMARGRSRQGGAPDVVPLELTKWFDTNYHYLVPELQPEQDFRLTWDKAVQETKEAIAAGFRPKPVVIGPVTFLALSKMDGGDPLSLIGRLVPVYRELLEALAEAGAEWVEISEPILASRRDEAVLSGLEAAWDELRPAAPLKLLLGIPFGRLGDALPRVCALGFDGLHVDATRAAADLPWLHANYLQDRVLSLGLIDGRSIWRSDVEVLRALAASFREKQLWLGTSCSLQHVPHRLDAESTLDPVLRSWLSFAKEKIGELLSLAAAQPDPDAGAATRAALASRRAHPGVKIREIREAVARLDQSAANRGRPLEERLKLQRQVLKLPLFPTTTIGSFPQTAEIRRLRARHRKGELDTAGYEAGLDAAMRETIRLQEDLGLDVLVHGEFERTDMVEFFGEMLEGITVTSNGWVQSYGSRCVKPPIIWGDIVRPTPMTVGVSAKAQALTSKLVKGMLTGPITILQWSFVRVDLPRALVALQLALAIRKEVTDLEAAGLRVIQVDEPGLREGLPLDPAERESYLEAAVRAFRVAVAGVRDETQIHTHMCYAEFDDVAGAIAALEADVISLEASRSRMEALHAVTAGGIGSDVGPGVWDIHSPRVPSVEEMTALLERAADVLPAERLWVNPDCGLKTRGWEETKASLENLVAAAKAMRTKTVAAV